jgi:hypothetical protein
MIFDPFNLMIMSIGLLLGLLVVYWIINLFDPKAHQAHLKPVKF